MTLISTKQLVYALALEQTLHFKKAADQCNVSQSALSTALGELEKRLGFQVFERDNKKVLITPAGRAVLDKARTVVYELEAIQRLADAQKAPLTMPISVGIIPTVAPYLLPKLLPALSERYPDCQLSVVEEQSHVLVDMVRRGELDTAILALPYATEGLLALEFWQEDFYWVALKGEELSNKSEITSRQLQDRKLMLLRDGHCLKEHVLDVCKLSPTHTNQGLSATSLNTLIQMILNKMGTTLIPEMALGQLIQQHPQLCAAHLKEPSPHRRIACLIRPNYPSVNSVDALMAVCRQVLADPHTMAESSG